MSNFTMNRAAAEGISLKEFYKAAVVVARQNAFDGNYDCNKNKITYNNAGLCKALHGGTRYSAGYSYSGDVFKSTSKELQEALIGSTYYEAVKATDSRKPTVTNMELIRALADADIGTEVTLETTLSSTTTLTFKKVNDDMWCVIQRYVESDAHGPRLTVDDAGAVAKAMNVEKSSTFMAVWNEYSDKVSF